MSNELQYEDEVAQASLQSTANQKHYCTSCQADRTTLGGVLQPYKTGSVIRRRWKCALCANRISQSRFSSKTRQSIMPRKRTSKPMSNADKLVFKKQCLEQICALLKEQEIGLEASAIATLLPDLNIFTVKRYLEELWVAGHVSRQQTPDARKRAWSYRYPSAYGTKTDMVSLALANPLHHLVTKVVPKAKTKIM